jgi:energy-coupling factor transport system ATP-binding protein
MLEARGLGYRYPGAGGWALSDVSLAVGEGEGLLVAGESGGGKSTLLAILAGLCPRFLKGEMRGEIRLDGEAFSSFQDWAARTGLMTQNPETQFLAGSVEDELYLTLRCRGVSGEAARLAVEERLEAFGIRHVRSSSVFGLSEGQKQKVVLASLTALRPRALLLDEPSANLDPAALEGLAAILRKAMDDGVSVIVADHRLYWLKGLCSRVLVLSGGAPAASGGWEILSDPADRERLGLRCADPPVRRSLPSVGGPPPSGGGVASVGRGRPGAAGVSPAAGGPAKPCGEAASGIHGEAAPGNQGEAVSGIQGEAVSGIQGDAAPGNHGVFASGNHVAYASGKPGGDGPGAPGESGEGPVWDGVEMEGLTFSYPGGPLVLDRFSGRLPSGRVCALSGPSGRGKTTLARLLCGLERPLSGRVLYGGRKAGADLGQVVLQNSDHQLYMPRALDEIAVALGGRRRDAERQAMAVLEAFGLGHLAGRHPQSLSGGEKQRLVVAAGLARPTRLAVLDEPTSGLDGRNLLLMAGQIRAAAESGPAVLVITHDEELVGLVADCSLDLGPPPGDAARGSEPLSGTS